MRERSKNGTNLSFTYFKKTTRTFSSWYGYYPEDTVDSLDVFYLGGQFEVSNNEYWVFLDYLKGIDSLDLFEQHRPKTENWSNYRDDFNIADSMAQQYDSLEIFGNHPVVNVTPQDALAYANWLNSIEPDSTVIYQLFTRSHWLLFFNENENIDSSFAWESNYWKFSSHIPQGNYAEFDQDQIRYNHISDKISWYGSDSLGYSSFVNGPMKCGSYSPNYWGAYDMSGNVAEITSANLGVDGKRYCKTRGGSWHSPVFYLREIAEETYALPSPYVGFRIVKIQFKDYK
jgi:formylglycine-generating enzyme required for sulfatase activity